MLLLLQWLPCLAQEVEGCVSDNGMTSVSGHTLLLLDTEGLGDVDKVRTPTLHYLHTVILIRCLLQWYEEVKLNPDPFKIKFLTQRMFG